MGKKKQTTISWPTPRQKRKREESASPGQDNLPETQLGSFDSWLKDKLKSRGVEDLFEDISLEVDKERKKLSADIKRMVVTECQRQKDINQSKTSICIQNVDSLVDDIGNPDSRISLVDQVTRFLHDICNGTVSVIDAYTLDQRGTKQQLHKAICVVLGSMRQKATCFRALLAFIRSKAATSKASNLSLRDVFPKERMSDVKKLVQQGLALKRDGKIARFKVRNRGPDAIPVLEIRKLTDNQQRGNWQVYAEENGSEGSLAKVAEVRPGASLVTDGLLLEPHTEEVEMSYHATDDVLSVSAAAPAVQQRDLMSSTSSEKSNLDSDTDSEPVFEIPPNMLLKLPKAARDWKVVAKNPSKKSFWLVRNSKI
jgi:hypothetical protein